MQHIERYLVFASRERLALAQELAKARPERFELCELEQHLFSDGEPNFSIPRLHDVFNQDVLYVADWSSAAARYYDLLCLVPIAELGPRTLTILVPFMGSGTMERESVPGSVATANVDAKLLSALPGLSRKRIVTVDLHTLQNQFYFSQCAVSMESVMPEVRKRLCEAQKFRRVVCFPDDGAKKRFARYFADCELASCGKVRDGETRRVTLEEGDVAQRNVLIVDDLTRTGGTLLECAKVLKAQGALAVSIFVPHAVFPQQEWRKFVDNELIARFHTTDSVPRVAAELRAADPKSDRFEVWSLASCIGSAF